MQAPLRRPCKKTIDKLNNYETSVLERTSAKNSIQDP
jgi:hypothetical protein